MPTFRFHRGSLEESMKTCVVIKDKKELLDFINKNDTFYVSFYCIHDDPDNIKIKPYGFDKRIGWNTHIVYLLSKEDKYYPIGFLSDNLHE